jgi:tripartite-type tricarboxylate transporter receptor subunit TctC
MIDEDENRAPAGGLRRRQLLAGGGSVLGLTTLGLAPRLAQAQAWPAKAIRIVAAQAPGASNDTTARALAEFMTAQLNQTVFVENKPGGVGMIAAETVAHSPPDGYTLLITLHSQLAQAPVLLKKPPIDTSKDLVPIGAYSTGVSPLVVKKDLPVKNLKELIALSKQRPVSVGNYGAGSGWQIMVTQLAKQTGGQFDIIPYKGTGPMVMDLMSGNVDIGAGSMAGMAGAIQGGQVRPIMLISGTSDNPLLPGMPNWADEGFTGPAFQSVQECNMVLAPAGTPDDIIKRIAHIIDISHTESPRMKGVLAQLGVTQPLPTGEGLKAFVARVWPAYQALTKELNLTPT